MKNIGRGSENFALEENELFLRLNHRNFLIFTKIILKVQCVNINKQLCCR